MKNILTLLLFLLTFITNTNAQKSGIISEIIVNDTYLYRLSWKYYGDSDTTYTITYLDRKRNDRFDKIDYKGKVNDFYDIFANILEKPIGTSLNLDINNSHYMIMYESRNRLIVNKQPTYFFINIRHLNRLFGR